MVNTTEPEPVMVCGLKLAVAPAGTPVTLKDTVPLKPFRAAIDRVKLAHWPGLIGCGGVIENVKSGAAFTVSVAMALWLRLPLIPVIVSVEFPTGVPEVVCTVSVEEPAPAIGFGLKVAVAPTGNPLTVRLTLPLKPLTAVVVTV